MLLAKSLSFLLDDAAHIGDGGRLLLQLSTHLMEDGLPIIAGALAQDAPDPIISRRIWLWRAPGGEVVEALGIGADRQNADPRLVLREWLGTTRAIMFDERAGGVAPTLVWAFDHTPDEAQSELLRQISRFAAAPMTALAERSAKRALLEAYLGKRSAAHVLNGHSRRVKGETIRAALLCADLRGFTDLSEVYDADEIVLVLDAWFDCVAGAVHAFGGEVLKFIGDGVLAIFPIGERDANAACDAAVRAVKATRAGIDHLNQTRRRNGGPELGYGIGLHVGEILWGNIGTAGRLDFTAIGKAVNLVSRIEGLCKPLGRTVLASTVFEAETTEPMIAMGSHPLGGIAGAQTLFGLPE
ncbi:adenylate/guanylate cyclase domain-containing protein [Mesorhizobium sp. M0213]|uniref:adenylate/guanylate cyclase domain-containing protein n=1 Tax=unclassified Mesorhizobium TaxID=325217 RepID=UPI00333BE815